MCVCVGGGGGGMHTLLSSRSRSVTSDLVAVGLGLTELQSEQHSIFVQVEKMFILIHLLEFLLY